MTMVVAQSNDRISLITLNETRLELRVWGKDLAFPVSRNIIIQYTPGILFTRILHSSL